jgi:type I restriction enzyme, S subunit
MSDRLLCNELPLGWTNAKFKDIVHSFKRGPFGSAIKKEFFVPDGYKVYEQKNAIYGDPFRGEYYIDKAKYEELSAFQVKPRDFIVSCSGTIGRILMLPENSKPGIINQALLIIRIKERLISNKFFLYLFRSEMFQRLILVQTRGSAMKNITGVKDLKLIPINLPPLPEQNEIVSKIEELFSELDNGVESLKKAREQLKTYRQAVLKYAFEGKLTQEWRDQQIHAGNPPEPAEKLLARIKKEREAQYQKQVEAWQKACELAETDGSKKPAKPKKPKDLPPLTEKELAELPELPEGWVWCKLGSLSCLITKGASPKWQGFKYVNDPCQVLFITSENIRNNYINMDCPKYLENAFGVKQKNSVLQKGDVLLNIVGASIGRAAIYNLNFKANINQAVSLIRLTDSSLKTFLSIFLNTSFANEYYNSKKVDFARANLSLADVSNIPIPLCSKNELNLLISEIETRLSVCDQLEQTIEDSLKQAEALRQSILKKAFEGELTREWREAHPELISGENSAESLLARIRAEKAASVVIRKKPRARNVRKA